LSNTRGYHYCFLKPLDASLIKLYHGGQFCCRGKFTTNLARFTGKRYHINFYISTFGSLVADWSVDNMIPYQLSLDVGESQQTKKTKKNKQTNKKEKRNSRSRCCPIGQYVVSFFNWSMIKETLSPFKVK
jgi:hypothetical protein